MHNPHINTKQIRHNGGRVARGEVSHLTNSRMHELQDRSMRSTLIFKGIPENAEEKTWDDSSTVLAGHLHMLTPEISVDEYTNQLDRAHRGKSTTNGARPIIAKFHKWKDSEAVKRNAIMNNKDITKTKVQVAQKYSQNTTERINEALKYRKDLLKTEHGMKLYVSYPAKLMGKRKNDTRYKIIEEF